MCLQAVADPMGLGEGEFASATANNEFHEANFRCEGFLNTFEYRKCTVGSNRVGSGVQEFVRLVLAEMLYVG